MTTPTLSTLHNATKNALLKAGGILRKDFLKKNSVSYKDPLSPATQTDLLSERTIIKIIQRSFPAHKFLGEESNFLKTEFKSYGIDQGYRWIVDPLDGTVNFIHGFPQFCVSVAVERKEKILVGGVYDPIHHELFMAVNGKGSTLNGRRILVSRQRDLQRALLITGFPYDRNRFAKQYLKTLEPFVSGCAGIRRLGAAALDLAWIACGRADGFFEYKLHPWDVAAGYLLVKEAGGKISDFSGTFVDLDNPFETLATNGKIHSQMVKAFSKIRGIRTFRRRLVTSVGP